MKNHFYFLFIILIFTSIEPLFGQFHDADIKKLSEYTGSQVRLRTESGATFQGILYSDDAEFVTIIDRDGQAVTILKEKLSEAWISDPGLDKKSYFQDSAANRLLVMPTGFPMEPEEFHIADQEIAAVTMSYGVNDNISLWGGISIPGALVSARYILQIGEKSAISVGSFAGLSWLEFLGLLIPYTVFSTGSPENNFTVGAGAVFGFDEASFELNAAILAIGGKTVLSDTTAIVTETWIIWGEMRNFPAGESTEDIPYTSSWDYLPIAAVPGIAFRIAGEKFSWDIGAVLPLMAEKQEGKYHIEGIGGETGFIPIPLISLTYRID